jgi:hypothetical protein
MPFCLFFCLLAQIIKKLFAAAAAAALCNTEFARSVRLLLNTENNCAA